MAEDQELSWAELNELYQNQEVTDSRFNGLTIEEISKISVVEVPVGESCCICLCELEASQVIRQLECRHIFHEDCLLKWVESHITCPLCRHRLTQRQTMKEMIEEFLEFSDSDDEALQQQFLDQGFHIQPVQLQDLETSSSMSISSNSLSDRNDSFDSLSGNPNEEIDEASGGTNLQSTEDRRNQGTEHFDWAEAVDEEMSIDRSTTEMDISENSDQSPAEEFLRREYETERQLFHNVLDLSSTFDPNLMHTSQQHAPWISGQHSYRFRSSIESEMLSSPDPVRSSLMRPRRLLRRRPRQY